MSNTDHTSIRSLIGGHSKLELQLSAYILILTLAAAALFIYTDSKVSSSTSPNNYASVSRNGNTSTVKQKSDPTPTSYSQQTVHGHDFQVALKFDPNAYGFIDYAPNRTSSSGSQIPDTGTDELYIIGKALGSSNQLVLSITPTSPGLLSPKTNTYLGLVPAFNTSIMGKQYMIYGYGSSNPGVIVDIQVGQSWYQVRIDNYVRGGAKNIPISQAQEEAILSSISIQN